MSGISLRTDQTATSTTQTDSTAPIAGTVTTGSGVAGSKSVVPDGGTPVYASVMQSLRTMMPNIKGGDFEALLAQVTSKLKDAMGDVQESRADNEMETKRVAVKENEAKIEEAKKKLDEAEAKKNSSNIFDILSLVFEAIAAAVLMVAGALISALPGGQALGAMMIISGAIMAISVANSICAKCNDGAGLLGSIAKAAGASDDVVMGMDIAMTVALVVGGIAAAVATGGASFSGLATNLAKGISTGINVGLQLAQTSSTVVSASINMSAAVDRSDASKLKAESQDLQAMMQQLDDMIDMAMTMLMQVRSNVSAMMDSLTEMLNDTGNTLSNTKFAG